MMEPVLFPQTDPFDNELLFDTEGHLTDEGLHALQDGRLDELGRLEAAEHLTFCDYCLARYTALIEAAPERLRQPMRDLIPQVQALMRLRRFRVMSNRYVSTVAAAVMAFTMWQAGMFRIPVQTRPEPQAQNRFSISQSVGGFFSGMSDGLNEMLSGMQLTIDSGLTQLADPAARRTTNQGE